MYRWICSLWLSVVLSCFSVAAKPTGNWVTLTNCQLIHNPANDGDSFHVRCNGREYIFRLYFVDTPETDDSIAERVTEQAAYFHISKQSVLAVGQTAKQFSAGELSRGFAVITRWEDAMGRSHLPRSYACVRIYGRDLGEMLVENGLARVFGARANLPDGTTTVREKLKLRNLEQQAKAARRGAWAYATGIPQSMPPSTSRSSDTPRTKQPNAGTTNSTSSSTQPIEYRISATGIRHNSNCRYFNGATTEPCGPNDGRPCKICGG